MRYIGGKTLMLQHIEEVIDTCTEGVESMIDMFSGSGVVAAYFKRKGLRVISNDSLYFSYVLNRGTLDLNIHPDFSRLLVADPIDYLNNVVAEDLGYTREQCFISQNYSPNDHCNRMYLQPKNAKKVDMIRLKIEEWHRQELINDDEYYYLLAALVAAVPYVSNIAGVYGAYLKSWDQRTYKDLELKHPDLIHSTRRCQSFNEDANLLSRYITADVAYLDPPYNARQYLPNYHVLETIARYDYPQLKGVSGMREYSDLKSAYCQKAYAAEALRDLLDNLQTRYIVMSYNNEGIIDRQTIEQIFNEVGIRESYRYFEFDYRRYKSKIPNNRRGLKEQLYFVRKY